LIAALVCCVRKTQTPSSKEIPLRGELTTDSYKSLMEESKELEQLCTRCSEKEETIKKLQEEVRSLKEKLAKLDNEEHTVECASIS